MEVKENVRDISTSFKYMGAPRLDGGDRKFSELFESYLYNSSRFYRGDSDAAIFLDQLNNAVERSLKKSGKKPLLLLSDGKDSLALAIALSEIGVMADTLTFLRRDDQELRSYITKVATGLGHAPSFINADEIHESFSIDTYLAACSNMPYPVIDQAFIYFLFGVEVFLKKNNLVGAEYLIIDGMGNDEYFGNIPDSSQRLAYKLSKFNKLDLFGRARSPLAWYLRSPVGAMGLKSAMSNFFRFPFAHDMQELLGFCYPRLDSQAYLDYRSFVRGLTVSKQAMMGKTITVASFFNMDVCFPWEDQDLSDYCFNLPVEEKFCLSRRENKVIIRSLLDEKLGWSQTKRGVDLLLDLDMEKFRSWYFLPEKYISKIEKSTLLPSSVKKRALLELTAACGYCVSNGYSADEITEIFGM